jgi:hypothetical protein
MDVAKIRSIELSRPHLTWISHDLYDISGRIRDMEPGLFIMYNRIKERFEVHSTDNKGIDTYCFTVPHKELDARTLADCAERCVSRGGYERLLAIERHNRLLGERRKRRFERDITDASLEAARDVSLAVEKDDLHAGYARSHYMGGRPKQ